MKRRSPRGGFPLSGAALEDLFHLFARHRQLVDVIAQPRGEIGFDSVGPTRIDLARGVLFFAQPLVAEAVAQLGDLGVLHYFFGKLRRDEHDAAVPSQDNVAGQHGGAPNADGDVDADHGRVHAVARREVAEALWFLAGFLESLHTSSWVTGLYATSVFGATAAATAIYAGSGALGYSLGKDFLYGCGGGIFG